MAAWRYDIIMLQELVQRAQAAAQNLASRVTTLENHDTSDDAAVASLSSRMSTAETNISTLQTNAATDEANIATLQTNVANDEASISSLQSVQATKITLTVVADLASLPASAGARQWFRVAGDTNVYVGNGAGQPLTKIPTVPM